jgi:hypothetical protein
MNLDFVRDACRALAIAGAVTCLPGLAIASVTVSSQIPIAKGVTVKQKILDQCAIQTKIPAAIGDASEQVSLVEGPGSLKLEISNVHAPGGWVFSGPKWVEVKGKLSSGNSFRAKRYSVADPFTGGVCGILAKISRALGQDIAAWVENPVDGAELGDAQ